MKVDEKVFDQHMRFLLEDTKKPTVVIQTDGSLVEMNQSFTAYFNIKDDINIFSIFQENSHAILQDYLIGVKDQSEACYQKKQLYIQGKLESTYIHLFCSKEDATKVVLVFNEFEKKKESPVNYGSVFKKSDNLMILMNTEGIIVDVNSLTEKFFNVKSEDLIGKRALYFMNSLIQDPVQISSYFKQAILDGYAEMTCKFQRNDYESNHYHMTTFFDEETALYVMKIADYTLKMKLEERLLHANSLSSIGQLAASIAHEIRNPITTLKGFIQLLKMEQLDGDNSYFPIIEEEILRMESILAEMLVLSKPSTKEKKVLSLQDIMQNMCQVVHPKAQQENIRIIQKDLTFGNAYILGDEGRLKQLLLNLFKNSFEAITECGTISLRIEKKGTKFVQIIFEDTGGGMSDEQIANLYTPFYTTKEKGTGLGMFFIIQTVEELGGSIEVESKKGFGTKFIISIPKVTPYHSFEVS